MEKFTVKKDSKIAFNLVYNPQHVTMNFMLKKRQINMTLPKETNKVPITDPREMELYFYILIMS